MRMEPVAPPTESVIERDYDELAPIYDHLYNDAVSVLENTRVKRQLQRILRPDDAVLDLGCGTGLFWELGLPCRSYIGVDISQGMLDAGKGKGPEGTPTRLVHGCMWEWLLTDLQYSSVTMRVSLFDPPSYRVHDDIAVPLLLRRLKPGDRFFYMFRSGRGDSIFNEGIRGCSKVVVPRRSYTMESLTLQAKVTIAMYGHKDLWYRLVPFNHSLKPKDPVTIGGVFRNAWGEIRHPNECEYIIFSGGRRSA